MNKFKQTLLAVINASVWTYKDCCTLLFNILHSPQLVTCVLANRITHRNNLQVSLCRSRFKWCRIGITGINNSLVIEDGCNFSGLKVGLRMGGVKCCLSTINASANRRVYIGVSDGCNVVMGRGCLLSDNIHIHTTDYHPVYDCNGERINPPSDIIIGNNVWICKDVMINKGTYIPDGCIVGARALVNKKFDTPNAIIAGIPAKVIKHDVRWCH